ncbi:hypothetical protein IQ247_10025 [Plectonema cf. radiosum LEGE 06105]|uniref:Uncharacterized protein n=1 Tax=Plectonema cf. radiosum LEGE 06105 TaxID=945769 RepID=A0A8J7K2G0_9CYAN|nr:hypothetical protein [Plectonema radiosum]MBE9213012.1 hypothetical protein [Plectonema cf. radiosum LEGE 06105]
MIATIIILFILAIIGIVLAVFYLYSCADQNYNFNVFGFGSLSLIPPALASIGHFIVGSRNTNYLEALLQKDIDVVVSLGIASLVFIWIFVLIIRRTNFLIALLTMLLVPPSLFTIFLILIVIGFGLFSSPIGWLWLIWMALNEKK